MVGHWHILDESWGLNIKIAYPDTKDYPKNAIEKIKSLGAEPIPMKPNILSIVTSSVANLAKKENYQMMPYAFDHPVYTHLRRQNGSFIKRT